MDNNYTFTPQDIEIITEARKRYLKTDPNYSRILGELDYQLGSMVADKWLLEAEKQGKRVFFKIPADGELVYTLRIE